ncbi:unnamed protein product [Meganyctiphanes norvegica]|uniref:C2H2-type domain-containing protein n=1 Tax=Meganyctiphanes norvegica TaxID=48144 RepID=A0AAV2RLL3_MEGNR
MAFVEKRNPAKQQRIYNCDKPYHQCDKISTGKQRLETYQVTNTEEKTYQCSLCNKTFNLSSNLNRHMSTHIGGKQYKTRQNFDDIKDKQNIVKNQIAYSEESSYHCRQCDKAFSSEFNLKRHSNSIHTVGKIYQCNQCNNTFSRKDYLVTHLRTHTGEKPYQCNLCNKTFTESSNLNRHASKHTGKKQSQSIKCKQCDTAFTRKDNLLKHLRKQH